MYSVCTQTEQFAVSDWFIIVNWAQIEFIARWFIDAVLTSGQSTFYFTTFVVGPIACSSHLQGLSTLLMTTRPVFCLQDRAAQGRACGNLGNVHYLLGDFAKAIHYHLVSRDSGEHTTTGCSKILASFSVTAFVLSMIGQGIWNTLYPNIRYHIHNCSSSSIPFEG